MCVGVHLGAGLDNSNFWGFWVKMKDFWMILSVFLFSPEMEPSECEGKQCARTGGLFGVSGGCGVTLTPSGGVISSSVGGGGLQGRFSLDFEERCWGGGMWSRFRGC